MLLTAHADRAGAYQGLITLWIAGGAVLILYLVSDPRPLTNPVTRTAQRIGMVSYALYLWQLPVIKAVVRWTPDWGWPGRLLLTMVHPRRLRRRLLAGHREAGPGAAPPPRARAVPGSVPTTAVSDAGG